MEDMEGYSMDDDELQRLYAWIDEVPLSRQKKNISRDFSDGVLVAEIVHHFLPKFVDLHNFSPANSATQKVANWNLLNRKVFSKLSFHLPDDVLQSIVKCKPGVVEFLLNNLRLKIQKTKVKLSGKVHQRKHRSEPSQQIAQQQQYHDAQSQSHHYTGRSSNYSDSQGYITNTYHNPESGQFTGSHHLPTQHSHQIPVYYHDPSADRKGYRYETNTNGSNLSNGYGNTSNYRPAKGNKSQPVRQDVMIAMEEKTQALLASQETVQILQAKIRRIEHLLHLKDLRIEELQSRLTSKESKGNLDRR